MLYKHAAYLLIVPASVASLTFGRDTARYFQLIAILAAVSTVLWIVVFITTVIRLLAHFIWSRRRPHAPQTLADKPVPSHLTADV